jgi:hypothetical protein
VEVLNKARLAQEQRLPSMSRQAAAPVYADMERSSNEIKKLSERNQLLQEQKLAKDTEITELNKQIAEVKDIGTFKFIADAINKPLDNVVILFICLLICVFDPLAVSLILAFNVATYGKLLKEQNETKDITFTTSNNLPITHLVTETEINESPTEFKTFHGTVK